MLYRLFRSFGSSFALSSCRMILPAIAVAISLLCACCGGEDTSEFDSLAAGKISVETIPDNTTDSEIPSVAEIMRKYTIKQGPRYHDRLHINSVGRLADVFNDSNRTQYIFAEALGIRPITSLATAYHTSRPIIHIVSNEYYLVDSLEHSLPFLVPEAARLLKRIGANFIDSLGSRGADGYRIKVTSLLRTPATVKRLRRVNVNATDSSTHQFGTTFDLSYVKFDCRDSTRTINEEDLKNLLAEVLYDLRRQEACLVKFERKTGCFHITVTH